MAVSVGSEVFVGGSVAVAGSSVGKLVAASVVKIMSVEFSIAVSSIPFSSSDNVVSSGLHAVEKMIRLKYYHTQEGFHHGS